MIGTTIRGIRHLWRMSDCHLKKALIRGGEHGIDICWLIKTPVDSPIGEHLFIFNPWYNHMNYGTATLSSLSCSLDERLANVPYHRVCEINNNEDSFKLVGGLFQDITLLPDTFDEDYASFMKANGKMVNSIIEKYGINRDDVRLKRIYIYTDGSKNFFKWAADLYYKYSCSIDTINNILVWNSCYKQLVKKLSKGTITAYTNQAAINLLMEEMSALRNEKRINDSINSFNTAQKKLLKSNELSDNDKKALARFSKLSETKRVNFIRKVSTVNDFQELMRQLKHATTIHFDWNKESFMDFIHNVEGINYEIIYENDLIVLVKVLDYETIKHLGKTTNWCISKNKSYWNNYIDKSYGKSEQYMIFDFSRLEDDNLSIIGFTETFNKGITAAHNFINDSIMGKQKSATLMIKSYLSRFDKNDNIYTILERCGIDINLIVKYDKPLYEWNYDAMMRYLYECVSKYCVDIIKHNDNKLVLSVRDEDIKYFFGDSYMEKIPSEEFESQHIIFADFDKNQYDPNRLVFATIHNGDEDFCNGVYNSHSDCTSIDFDTKLMEFGVPYDIIRRTYDKSKMIANAFVSLNFKMLEDIVGDNYKEFDKVLRDKIGSEVIFQCINKTIVEYLSFDYLNFIYKNGHLLSEYLDNEYINGLVNSIFSKMRDYNVLLGNGLELIKPSESTIEAFYSEKLDNSQQVTYVGYYLALKKIMEMETSDKISINRVYANFTSTIWNEGLVGDGIKELLGIITPHINMENETRLTNSLVRYFYRYGDEEMLNTVINLASKYRWVDNLINKNEKAYSSVFSTAAFTYTTPF